MKSPLLNYTGLLDIYSSFKNEELTGRYITYSHIINHISFKTHGFPTETIGRSFNNIPIDSITIGTGKIKILAWSQMHGNETTTTKAVFDIIKAFTNFPDHPFLKFVKDKITFKIIPMLNPDGAQAYTRENFNKIDLNRDAQNLDEIESQILRTQIDQFKPHFCFNLHDQRTIFSAGKDPFPATLSFLAPSMNEKREILPSRTIAMKIIAGISSDMEKMIPGQIGRYDDAYNINCTGDTFQTMGIPTILFEAGHYQKDYLREKTREFLTASIFSALKTIASENWKSNSVEDYLNIPENEKKFYDILLKNAVVRGKEVSVAIQFNEELQNGQIEFIPKVEKIANTLPYYAHKEIDLQGEKVQLEDLTEISENVVVHKLFLKNEVLIINYHNN